MSSHGQDEHGGPEEQDAEHGGEAHAHHDFDPEPTGVVPDDEPRTPGWVPAVGGSLFVVGAVAFLAMGDTSQAATGAAGSASASAASSAKPTITAVTAREKAPGLQPGPGQPGLPPGAQRPLPGAVPMPPPGGSGSLKRLNPEEAKAIQDKMEQLKKAREGAPPQPGH